MATYQSNLEITLNYHGEVFNCSKCRETITDRFCFCNECGKYLHPQCAGVKILEWNGRDGRKRIKLLAPEDLPVSCPDCLSQGSSQIEAAVSSFASIDISGARKHMLCKYGTGASLFHKLVKKDYGEVYICSGCKEIGFGCHHACQNEFCPVRFHEECKSPHPTIMHPAYPKLSFAFYSEPEPVDCEACKEEHSDTSCSACGMYANGYFYGSEDDEHHLHPRCANLPSEIKCRDTGATMELRHKTTSKCCYCNKKRVKRGDKKTSEVWSYVSDGVSLHVQCIIKMLSDLEGNKSVVGRRSCPPTLYKNVRKDGTVVVTELQVAGRADAMQEWEERCIKFLKYAKIALAAIVSVFLGDPTTLFVNLVVALVS